MSSSSSIESAVRSGFQQLRVQEARRNADQADQAARALEAQARAAQRNAARANENARELSVQSDQARDDAGRARQGVAYLDSLARSRKELGGFLAQVVERQPVEEPTTTSQSPASVVPAVPAFQAAAPVVNAQGQLTGTLVSTKA